MAFTREQLIQLFQSQFNLTTWNTFIVDFFKANEDVKINPSPSDYIDVKDGVGYELGYCTVNDTKIGFFCLKLDRSIDKRKVGLRQMIDKYIKIESDAGVVVFDDGNHWRLSFITDMRGEKTSPKRYTFVFGDKQSQYRTAVERFMELQREGITFENIKKAFSVEALTKQFYNDLFNWYSWALKEDTGVYFPNNPHTPIDDRERLDTKMIRLITRLMFVWFIKQKGLVPNALFDFNEVGHWLKDFDAQSMESANYYQAILQNLFFATLNRPIKTVTYDKNGKEQVERRGFAHLQGKSDVKSLYRYADLFKIGEDKILSIFEFIPFINGGLFECLDKNKTSDGVDFAYYEDGFSRCDTVKDGRWTRRAFIPNKLFFDPEDGILSIFNRYNFTVEENSPSEQQVALDPELLGKVFENLLGVYNPETQDTARKQSGSFYTPREIVNYMVDRSLETYLGNTEQAKALFKENFEYDPSQSTFYQETIEKLKIIKVLDPACGSGAFPMGMLNRIVEIMQNLNASGSKYEQKLQIMENCIFGGDIQTIAAQITKLRFFISLVCDCTKTDNPDDNYGIPNLPNLETHFVACDSLISLKKPQQASLFEQDVLALKEMLKEVRHEHFTAKTVYQKTKLRNRDKELRDELAKMLKSDNVIAGEDASMMAAWNPYDQNARASFFDPEWMFGIKDGFDVVIGNPPYIQLQKSVGCQIRNKKGQLVDAKLGDLYKTQEFETFERTGDIYCLFYEKGYKMLRSKGNLCFITSNKWMRAGYGSSTREFLTKKTNPVLLIDFAGMKIFENATVDTNILLFTKTKNEGKTKCVSMSKSDNSSLDNLSDFVEHHCSLNSYSGSDSWIILSTIELSIKRKIESIGTPLKDWDVQVNYGIKTGFNDAFIITTDKRNEILSNCMDNDERVRTEQLIRPILRGRDIKRYGYDWADLWLINTHNGIPNVKSRINIDDYPAVKQHLDTYWNKLNKRSDKGDTPYNLRNCAYLDDFSKPKIVYPETTQGAYFAFDDKGLFIDKTCFMLISNDAQYLQYTLSSRLFEFAYKNIFSSIELGEHGYQYNKHALVKLPVLRCSDCSILNDAQDIDKMIYSLYNISEDEIEFIESQ